MDERRFDDAARAIAAATSRRGALAGLAAIGAALPFGAWAKTGRDDRPERKDRADSAKKKKKCTPAKCPVGCCSGKRCKPGTALDACGAGGGACVACAAGEICLGGACVAECSPATCAGCCDSATNSCLPGASTDACGAGGVACAACAAGEVCPLGTCEAACGPGNCAGCCSAETNACKPGSAVNACGTGGAACAACAEDAPCCAGGACTGGTWTNPRIFGNLGAAIDELDHPQGVAVTADGRTVLISDTLNNRLSMWRAVDTTPVTWSPSMTFGSLGSLPNQFRAPHGVAVATDGQTAWVADFENQRIDVWVRPSAISTAWAVAATFGTAGVGLDQFQRPDGIAVSTDLLTVWASDAWNNRVSVWARPNVDSNAWTWQASFGSGPGPGVGELSWPAGLAASVDGLTVLVADLNNNRVSVWTRPNGSSVVWSNQATFGTAGTGVGQLALPSDVALSADGRTAWVADTIGNRISIWTRASASSVDWTNVDTFGSGPGAALGQLTTPAAVTVDADGRTAWVADSGNSRIAVWERTCP